MVKIKITLENEQGKKLSELESFDLKLGNQSLHEIETAVEKFKKKMLPELSKELLLKAQRKFTQEKKKIQR